MDARNEKRRFADIGPDYKTNDKYRSTNPFHNQPQQPQQPQPPPRPNTDITGGSGSGGSGGGGGSKFNTNNINNSSSSNNINNSKRNEMNRNRGGGGDVVRGGDEHSSSPSPPQLPPKPKPKPRPPLPPSSLKTQQQQQQQQQQRRQQQHPPAPPSSLTTTAATTKMTSPNNFPAKSQQQQHQHQHQQQLESQTQQQQQQPPPASQQPPAPPAPLSLSDSSGGGGGGSGGGGASSDSECEPFNKLETVNFCSLFKKHWLDVFTYCTVFCSFGMGVACLGPTLLDLGCQTATDLREMSWVFFVQLLMTSIGTIVAGYLANRCAVSFLLFLAMAGMPFTMFIIPSCTGLAGLVIVVMLMGLCMGCIDCVANLGMIHLFKDNVSPFLQAMHFSYGMGAFISPMVAEPFLLNVDCSPLIDGYQVDPGNSSHSGAPVTVPPSPEQLLSLQRESRLKNAFYIIGTIMLPVTLLLALLVFKKSLQMPGTFIERTSAYIRDTTLTATEPSDTKYGNSVVAGCFTCGSKLTIIITLLAASIMFLFDGLQSSYGGYVYSYSIKSVPEIKQSQGAVLNACFWGTFALGRLLAIVIAAKFTPAFMLLVNIIGACISIAITVIFSDSEVGIYLGTSLLGLFLSSASPTAISLTQQFIEINSSVTSTLVVFAGFGETLCPVIVGNLFVTVGPSSFLVFCFILIFTSLLLYIGFGFFVRETDRYTDLKNESFVWLPGVWRRRAKDSNMVTKSTVKYYSRMKDSPSVEGGTDSGTMELKALQANGGMNGGIHYDHYQR
ncbi:Hypothetical predicted protein [Argonauta hians]